MRERYLEVTFRNGKPVAGYLYLPRAGKGRCARTEEAVPGLLIDLSESGEALGLEIAAPGKVTLDDVNAALKSLGLEPITAEELAPLIAA